MSQALEKDTVDSTELDITAALTGDEPADVVAARAVNPERSISIQEALAAGGFDLLDDLRSQMEAGTAGRME